MTRENELKAKTLQKQPLRVLFVEDSNADLELCLWELQKAELEVRADVVQTPQEFAERLCANALPGATRPIHLKRSLQPFSRQLFGEPLPQC